MSLDKLIALRIREAREELGLSQSELADLIGFSSPTAIHYIEKGKRKIKVDDLPKFSTALNRPISYFIEGELSERSLTKVLLRSAVQLGHSENIYSKLSEFIESLNETEMRTFLPKIELRGLRPYAAAERLLEEAGISGPPVNVNDVADFLGLSIIEWEFDTDISAVLVNAQDCCVIGVNRLHVEERRRFSIAHEIGHFVLEHDDEEKLRIEFSAQELIQEQSEKRAQQEREANWFAADLLMPKDWVERALRKASSLYDLSSTFKVSEQAMLIRLQHFDLNPPVQEVPF